LYLSSFGGASGVLYFNNTCAISNYQSMGIYATHGASRDFTNPFPNKPMTIYAQARYYVSDWSGVTTDPAPYMAFIDSSSLQTLPAQKNLTRSAGGWVITTIWTTFPANASFKVGWFIPMWHNMPAGWKVYFDYFRVGYVDKEEFRDTEPTDAEKWADCGWASGWLSASDGCGASGNLWSKDTNKTVWTSVSGAKLGDDEQPDLFCQTWYANYSTKAGFNGTYVVRMPMEMSPFNYSSKKGEYHYSYGGMTFAINIDAYNCALLAKDYLYVSSSHSAFQWSAGFGICSCSRWNVGVFDTLSPNEVKYTSFGHGDTCQRPYGSGGEGYPWYKCGCNGGGGGSGCSYCSGGGSDVGGAIDFGWNYTQWGQLPLGNVSVSAQNSTWVASTPPFGTDCPDCCIYGKGTMVPYFRYNVPSSYLSLWNLSGTEMWKANTIGASGNEEYYSSWWLEGYHFFFGQNEPDMWNVTCTPDWYCNNGTEYYLTEHCDRLYQTSCGACGCGASRCNTGTDYWQCYNNFTTRHYNATCNYDLELLCDAYCVNSTGKCYGEYNCIRDSDCNTTKVCNSTTGVFTEGTNCNMTTYQCGFTSTNCTYGCLSFGCKGIPNDPIFTNHTTEGIISEITGGVLGFLSASGGSIFNVLFLMFVIVFIISLFGLVAYFIRKGFDSW
jgi:hypothetical protein